MGNFYNVESMMLPKITSIDASCLKLQKKTLRTFWDTWYSFLIAYSCKWPEWV